ncbi:MAG: AEC family transporter [Hyphomicrobiaceae bacterium]|nr:AEC family transporter [Hyphomicrobiaceae bacterium]
MLQHVAQVFTIIGPVFGLILIGYVAVRARWLDPAAGPGMAQFIFSFAIPALIFRTIVTADLGRLDPLPIAATFLGAISVVWLASSILARFGHGMRGAEVPAYAFAVGFSNVLILGLPLALEAFGPAALPILLVVVALDVPFMWFIATLQAALASRDDEATLGTKLLTLARIMSRNPIILATAAGLLWRATGSPLPAVADSIIALLGKAALPGALFALGATLTTFSLRGALPALSTILVLKLAVLPLVVWGLATHVLILPPLTAKVLTLAAACPTGINAYLFAARQQAAVGTVAGAIAATTLLSVVTLSIVLMLFAAT